MLPTTASPLLSESATQCPVSYEIFQSCWWAQSLFPALCEFCMLFPLTLLEGFISSCGNFLHPQVLISTVLNIWGGTSADFQSSLSAQLPPFLHPMLWTLAALVSPGSQVYLFDSSSQYYRCTIIYLMSSLLLDVWVGSIVILVYTITMILLPFL